ncbi:LAETG motif-containing sortase-dependent surface protein [Streptomyces sp. NPDC127084]|uniref:LAETG motif-containing sortase-dependent surface protein n=1 Tax=Streptomyces sp. NPDC127084 TaxID=3347133 RepID=UPI00364CFC3F
MKLRRAMAVAAATAVIAPAAFLAAPAAYATDDTNSTTSSVPSEEPATTGETGEEPGGDTEEPGTTGETGEEPGGDTEEPGTTGETGEEPGDDTEEPGTTGETGEEPGDDTEEPGDDTEEPGEGEEEWCEITTVDVSLSGFPNKIVAGSGWKQFKLNVKNTGETDIEQLEAFTFATYEDEYASEHNKLIEKYAHFEMKDPESGKWTRDFVGSNNGIFIGTFALDAGKSVAIDLRVKIDKGAPTGDAVSIVAGGDIDDENAGECAFDVEEYMLQVIAAGGDAGDVDDAKPTGDKPKSDVKPQGESKAIPVTGNLAETGSSSALPILGTVGGIAIVAGAGVVFAMKRRKGEATA